MLLKKRIQQAYFFRARKFDCLENLQKWNQTDFDSRKAYKIHNYGRLNKPYEEMMYSVQERPSLKFEVIGKSMI